MELEQLKKTRDDLKKLYGDQKAIKIRFDNNFEAHEIRQFVVWDDANSRISWIERTEEPSIERTRPIFVHTAHYENIQELYVELSPEEFRVTGPLLGFTPKQVEMVVGSIVLTEADFADSVGNHVKGRSHDVTV